MTTPRLGAVLADEPGAIGRRPLDGPVGRVIAAYAIAASLLHLHTAGFGVFELRVMRGPHPGAHPTKRLRFFR